MSITAEQIKELREKTGAGISDVKRALEESRGDMPKALKAIEQKLGGIAVRKATRETRAGLVETYRHSHGRIGSMVEVYCETDFVAQNAAFREFAHDIAMQIAAMQPLYLSLDSIPRDVWEVEKARLQEEVRPLHKPPQITEEIVEGKLKSYFGGATLLEQPFVKDQDKTVGEVLNEAIGRFGENIRIGKFVRFEL